MDLVLEHLKGDLDLQDNFNFTFISDRQKGIIPVIAELFPAAKHKYCLRHIHENMKLRWSGTAYKDLLWKAAIALTFDELPQFDVRLLDNFEGLSTKTVIIGLQRYHPMQFFYPTAIGLDHTSQVGRPQKEERSMLVRVIPIVLNNGKLSRRSKTVTYDCVNQKGHKQEKLERFKTIMQEPEVTRYCDN
ncbi:hypothetical protein Tco_0873275 [Tanacetum coccineum]